LYKIYYSINKRKVDHEKNVEVFISDDIISKLIVFAAKCICCSVQWRIFETEQPDKTIIKAKAYGDEFHHRIESLDGYTLVRDPETKWICYAKLNSETSELVSTGIPYTSTSKNNNVAKIKELKIPKNLDLSADQINKKVDKIKNDRKWDEFLDQCPKMVKPWKNKLSHRLRYNLHLLDP
jgi:hypothetical protein